MKKDRGIFICHLMDSPEFGKRELRRVPVACLEPWGANPGLRTEEHALRDLGERVTKNIGQLMPGSAVVWFNSAGESIYRIIDMHRRYELLKRLGIEFAEVIVYTDIAVSGEKFQKLFDVLNGGNRVVNTRERTTMAEDAPVAAGDKGVTNWERAKSLLNSEALTLFKKNNCPNAALVGAKGAYVEFADRGLLPMNQETHKVDRKEMKKFISACYVWQEDCGQQQALKLYLTEIRETFKRGANVKARNMCIRLLNCIRGNGSIKDLKLPRGVVAPDDERVELGA